MKIHHVALDTPASMWVPVVIDPEIPYFGSILHLVCRHRLSDTEKTILTLVRNGVDVDLRDDFDQTPLHHAIETQNLAAVRTLMGLNAKTNLPSLSGCTAESIASDLLDTSSRSSIEIYGMIFPDQKPLFFLD